MSAFLAPPPLHLRAHTLPCATPARRHRRAPSVFARARSGASSRVLAESNTPEELGFLHIATVTGAHGVHGAVKATATTDFAAHRLSSGERAQQRFLLLPGRRYPRPVDIVSARPGSRDAVWILRLGEVARRGAPSAPEHVDTLRLRGARLFVRSTDRPPLARGEFVAAELPGLRVALRNRALEPALAGAGVAESDDEADEAAVRAREEAEEQAYYVARRKRGPPLAAGLPVGVVTAVHTAADVCAASGSGKRAAAVGNDLLEVTLLEHDDLRVEAPFAAAVPDEATRVLVPFVRQIVPVVDRDAALVVLDPPAGLLDATVVNRAERVRPPRGLLMAARTE